MKSKFYLSIFALCTCIFGTAVGQEENQIQKANSATADSFNYLKLGLGGAQGGIKPSIGIGRRFGMEGSAIDVSFNWTGTDTIGYFSLPKMLYLSYLTPCSPTSFYYGAGLSLGRIGSSGHKFSGLLAEAAIGYEMQRDEKIKLFAEIDFSHGLVPFNSKNGFHGFSPALAFTVGAGF
jgi:hypothetical protein